MLGEANDTISCRHAKGIKSAIRTFLHFFLMAGFFGFPLSRLYLLFKRREYFFCRIASWISFSLQVSFIKF